MRALSRSLTVFMIVLLLSVILPMAAFANGEDTYGDKIESFDVSEDENSSVTVSIYLKNGEYILVVSGEGDMRSFSSLSEIPWRTYADKIVSVTLEKGVKNLPELFFHNYPLLRELLIYGRYVTLIADKQYIPYTVKIYGHFNSTAHLFVFENYPSRFYSLCDFADGACTECDYVCENHSGGMPTCTETGRCEICGAEYMQPQGHRFSKLVEEVAPTCYSTGISAHYVCLDCDEIFDKNNQPTTKDALKITVDHNLSELREYTAPTCTAPGFIAHYECSLCLDRFNGEQERVDDVFIPAVGHIGGVATCLSGAVCERCAAVYTDADLTNHSYGAELEYDESSHWQKCICGAIENVCDHIMTDKVIEEATELKMGILESACGCGYKTEKYIPKLPPKPNDDVENGEYFSIVKIIAITASAVLICALIVTVAVIVIKKIRRDKNIG